MQKFEYNNHVIFSCITGSHAYGTNTPESDIDVRGVVLPPLAVLLNPIHRFEQQEVDSEDTVFYDLGKFMRLAAANNPNILELLFIEPTVTSPEWANILKIRQAFISKKVRHTFAGYAVSQWHKLERHRKWLIDPPKEKPHRLAFGLLEGGSNFRPDQLSALLSIPMAYVSDNMQAEVMAERDYRDAKIHWDNYQTWLKSRNPARQALEMKYGYDTKCALHLMRLVLEGRDLLLSGELKFPLEYAKDLLDIKNGALSYEQFRDYASTADQLFDAWEKKSALPYSPDTEKIIDTYMDIVYSRLSPSGI